MDQFDHSYLCGIARQWLRLPSSRGGHGCQIVINEGRAGHCGGESPDSIGFRATGIFDGSFLVECKASRSDFLADKYKPHRQSLGMGKYRYYLCPEGMITVEDLPERWGLLWVNPKGRVKAVVGAAAALRYHSRQPVEPDMAEVLPLWAHAHDVEHECGLLVSLLNRVGDIDKINRWLRESGAFQSRQAREIAKLREKVTRLSNELSIARYAEMAKASPQTSVARATVTATDCVNSAAREDRSDP
jgi:hypothetical protein